MANIINYLEKIINGIKTNTFLQIATLMLIIITLLWNIMYSPDEREDQEMLLKEMVGLIEGKRSFEKEFNDLSFSDEDYKLMQNNFDLFRCKTQQYKMLTEDITVSKYCPKNELLPQCDNQTISNCYGEVIYEDDEIYFGEIINDEPNGIGVFTNRYAMSYWGNFKNGNQYSYGYITDNDGRVVYRGGFRDGLENGQGEEFIYEPNVYYKGQFLGGKAHGEGVIVASEFIYKGSLRKGVRHGQGVYFNILERRNFIFCSYF